MLCCKLDDHKVDYEAYKKQEDIIYIQKVLLHRVGRVRGAPAAQDPYTPYNEWHTSQVDWLGLERSLDDPSTAGQTAATGAPPDYIASE